MKNVLLILIFTLFACTVTGGVAERHEYGSNEYTPEAGLLKGMTTPQWEMQLKHDGRHEYDPAGHIYRHGVTTLRVGHERKVRYLWDMNDRLASITNELSKTHTRFDYDIASNLVGATYHYAEKFFRVPDAVGNLYKTQERKDRKYGAGGRLLESEDTKYSYDEESNLTEKVKNNGEKWLYAWNANGSLREVTRPDRQKVSFEYDALGRRAAKIFNGKVTRWVWDGNNPLHEWNYALNDRPKTIKDDYGFDVKDREEPVENLITWVFEEGTFKPTGRLTEREQCSIIPDYLGTPVLMYDEVGHKLWEDELDIYGKVRKYEVDSWFTLSDCPFRYQGQYEDAETGLYYNRHRYYSPDEGMYISQDPIGLAGNNPTFYGYVKDVNAWIDVFGLDTILLRHYTSRSGLKGIQSDMVVKAGDQGAVFATRAKGKPLSAADAVDKFKIQQNHAKTYIDFEIDSSRVEFRTNDLGVQEYEIKGDIELELDTDTGKYKAEGCH